MADPQVKTFSQIVASMAAAVQARASGLIDFSVGAVMRAFAEAVALVYGWLQALALHVLAKTRFATSVGEDADSWGGDFGFTRLLADKAEGELLFSRISTSGVTYVLVGAQAQTADGAQKFTVTADEDHPNWDAGQNGYKLNIGVGSVTVPAEAVTAGAAGNVAPDTVVVIASAIPGIDSVTNPDAFGAGSDDESDTDYRERFVLWVNSRNLGTKDAIEAGIRGMAAGVQVKVTENLAYDGVTPFMGHFVIIVDDGTGSPDEDFLAAVEAVVDAVRPITSTFEVHGPVEDMVAIVGTVRGATGYTDAQAATAADAALTAYVNSLALGAGIDFTRLYQIAYNAGPEVGDVVTLTLDGGIDDIPADATTTIRGTVNITAAT